MIKRTPFCEFPGDRRHLREASRGSWPVFAMPNGRIITIPRHSKDFILELYSVSFSPVSTFPLVQVFLYQNDPHFMFVQVHF